MGTRALVGIGSVCGKWRNMARAEMGTFVYTWGILQYFVAKKGPLG
jgi:hypothetical protein